MRHIGYMPLLTLICLLGIFSSSTVYAGEDESAITYVEIDPVIVTNYLRAKGKKPGFVQLQAQITVRGKTSEDMIEKHIPLIRAVMIEYLSFTDEATIKDLSKRTMIREALLNEIQTALTEVAGDSYAENLVITHFIWG